MSVDFRRQGDLLTAIFGSRDVYFDPAEANGSLYLCFPRGATDAVVGPVIGRMREAGAWGADVRKVADDQAAAYAGQLTLLECLSTDFAGETVLALRATHPKFPSRDASWEMWRRTLLPAAD